MVKFKLDYGKKELIINVPEKNLVRVNFPKEPKEIPDPEVKIERSLNEFLSTLASGKNNCVIVISDKTRAVPNKVILPPILKKLKEIGIKNIKILIATGMHSPTEGDDLIELVGDEIIKNYEIINHDCQNMENMVSIGKINSTEVYINKIYFESELKILTGLIEPHFMVGFSGGRKSICPGLVDIQTMKYFHGPKLLESKYSSPGEIEKNPCHQFATKVAKRTGADLIINVTLNSKGAITGIFTGEVEGSFYQGVEFCRKFSTVYLSEKCDVVITTNGGFPLDRDFYQTVKGLVAPLDVIREGGTIIIASECRDGIGSLEFKTLLEEMKDPQEFIQKISAEDYFCKDQWEVEEYVKVLKKANVKIFSENLDEETIKKVCHAEKVKNIEDALVDMKEKYGKNFKLAVLPHGPYFIYKIGSP